METSGGGAGGSLRVRSQDVSEARHATHTRLTANRLRAAVAPVGKSFILVGFRIINLMRMRVLPCFRRDSRAIEMTVRQKGRSTELQNHILADRVHDGEE